MDTWTNSAALARRAAQKIPGGVNSPVRAFGSVGTPPLFVDRAQGARVWDVDGNCYIDFIASWGPMILGHRPACLDGVLERAAARSTSFGLSCPAEVEMAETITAAYPGVEMVRMVNSGTEATMSAVRAARGYTGRRRFIKFEGCYHGHSDAMLVSAGSGALTFGAPTSPGVPEAVVRDTIVCRYNDARSVRAAFERWPQEIAAVIVEPVAANMGVVPPAPGFLAELRRLTKQYGAVLIFDEVITGFRLSFAGAAGYYGVEPDMACFGKIIGAGMPVGAYGGRREIMRMVSPEGPVYQAGTLSGNPLAMALGLGMLGHLREHPEVYAALETLGARLEQGLRANVRELGLDCAVTRAGSLVCLFLAPGPIESYDDVKRTDARRFAAYDRELLAQGILTAPSPYEALFVTAAHTCGDIDRFVAASRAALEKAFATPEASASSEESASSEADS